MKELELACESFKKLVQEQLDRIANANSEKVDYSTKETITIGIVDGDGIGPIITGEAVKILEHLLKDEIVQGKIILKKIEGLTIENL